MSGASRINALELRGVRVDLGERTILDGVSLTVRAGEVLALVGPNGAGKSTLLASISGDVDLAAGEIEMNGRPLSGYDARTAAQARAVLLQEQRIAFGFRCREVVEMGRTPWYRTPAQARDEEAVTEAMVRSDVVDFSERLYPSLSGGEKSRVALARVLAQETDIVLLDEPTAALDIRHQEQVLAVARDLAVAGRAVVVVLHDLSLAAAWADRVCVLEKGRVAAQGTPREVFTADLVSRVYEHPVDVIDHDGHLVMVPKRAPRSPMAQLADLQIRPQEATCQS